MCSSDLTPSIGILANVGHEIIDMEAAVRRNAFARTDEERADLVKKFNVARDNATRMLQQYEDSLVADSTDARDLRDTRAALNAFVPAAQELMSTQRVSAVDEQSRALSDSLRRPADALTGTLDRLTDYNQEVAVGTNASAASALNQARKELTIALMGIIALAISIVLAFFRLVIQPIGRLDATVSAIAAGELRRTVPLLDQRDETGSLARAIERLRVAALELEHERFTKSNTDAIVAVLQGTSSTVEFGGQLLGELLPLEGIGRAHV